MANQDINIDELLGLSLGMDGSQIAPVNETVGAPVLSSRVARTRLQENIAKFNEINNRLTMRRQNNQNGRQ